MTNLDKIRNMPAEDFAEYIINFNRCSKCVHYNKEEFECGYLETPVPCIDGVTKWLKQEINPMPYLKVGDIVINRSDVELVIQNACIGKAKDLATDTSISMSILTNDYVKKIYRYNKETGDMEEIWRAE